MLSRLFCLALCLVFHLLYIQTLYLRIRLIRFFEIQLWCSNKNYKKKTKTSQKIACIANETNPSSQHLQNRHCLVLDSTNCQKCPYTSLWPDWLSWQIKWWVFIIGYSWCILKFCYTDQGWLSVRRNWIFKFFYYHWRKYVNFF